MSRLTRSRLFVFGLAAWLVACQALPTLADGFRRRVVRQCSQPAAAVVHHAEPVVAAPVVPVVPVAPVLAAPAYAAPSAPLVQNHFYGQAPLLGSTVYGYSSNPAVEPLRQAYQVDPAAVLREAALLARQSQEYARENVAAYSQLGGLAITAAGTAAELQAQTDQLRARADLIAATSPPPGTVAAFTAPTTQAHQVQRLVSGGQTICITPDGSGGFSIRVEGSSSSSSSMQSSSSSSPTSEPAAQPYSQGLAVLKTRCASCHSGENAKGSLTLFDAGGNFLGLTADQAADVLASVESGRMPKPPAAQLTDTELAALTLLLSPQR